MNNLILFTLLGIFVLLGLTFLFDQRVTLVKHPVYPRIYIPVDRAQKFLIYSLLTGLIMFGYGGFEINTSAIRLLIWIGLLLLGSLFITKGKFHPTYAFIFYVLYLTWIAFMGVTSPVQGFAFRNFLKYLFPLLIFIFAMRAEIYELLFFKILKLLVWVSLFYLSCYYIPFLRTYVTPLFWGIAASADFFAVISIICIALFELTRQKKYLFFFVLFFSYSLLYTIRTGIVGLVIGVSVYYFIKYRIKSFPIISLTAGLLLSIILFVPNVRNKMFRDTKATTEEIVANRDYLSIDKIDTNARQLMWEWSLENFYEGKEAKGSGLGVLQATLYSGAHPFGNLRMVHNDYVQILCDTGLIGLSLFLLWIVATVWHCVIIYKRNKDAPLVQTAALISGATLVAIMACSFTDNAVNYSLATYSYPSVFYGITIFLDRREREPK